MERIFPQHLNPGDEIRIIAPSSSLGIISDETKAIANERLASLGFKLSFGRNVMELDPFGSSSIQSRIDDLHDAFANPSVKAVMCVIGGYNSNQLLPYVDWNIIKNNPKVFIGYSDITVLHNAIFARTGLVTYLGPAYSTFGQKLGFDYTLGSFRKCLMHIDEFPLEVAPEWSDDLWFLDQEKRNFISNSGSEIIQDGKATGELVGGNLGSFALLFGTSCMPFLAGKILVIEDDESDGYKIIDRNFESLLQQPGADQIVGIIFGRYQKASEMNIEKIKRLVALRPQLKGIPVIAQLDFGHTSPLATLPLGGIVSINTSLKEPIIFKKF